MTSTITNVTTVTMINERREPAGGEKRAHTNPPSNANTLHAMLTVCAPVRRHWFPASSTHQRANDATGVIIATY